MKKEAAPKKKKEPTFEEVSGEVELGVYPAAFHISAIPERRYLIAAKKIMLIALISICLNGVLGIGIFLIANTASNMKLSPYYIYWSELTDSFERIQSVSIEAARRACYRYQGAKATEFCSQFSNEEYYIRNFIRNYHIARYTVSTDLGDNAKRWCNSETNTEVIAREAIIMKNEYKSYDVVFDDFDGRSCVIARYMLYPEDYKTFVEGQADVWQHWAAKNQFSRDVEVLNIEPYYGMRRIYIATLKLIEKNSRNQVTPRVRYLRTITKIALGRNIDVGVDKSRPAGYPSYFNSNAYLYDKEDRGGIVILSHAVMADKTKVLREFYEPLGY